MVGKVGLQWVVDAILRFVGGPPGIFLVSMVSNSIPFVTVPYLGLIAGYSLIYRDPLGVAILIVVSSLGAASGKIVVYYLGAVARKGLSEISRRNVELFQRLAKRSLFLAIVVMAATPLPDDILYLPLGMMKYPLLPYFIAILTGKVVITSVVVFYASWITQTASNNVFLVPVWVVVTVILVYLVLKTDWYRVIDKLTRAGVRGAVEEFISQWVKKVREGLSRLT
ncbi:MAG: VTT domain-containing protein [Desulfurococcales archaeon]|nr:VTT domain-containing protein [Desulfurococcales archaeon]